MTQRDVINVALQVLAAYTTTLLARVLLREVLA
jgi:hypothetical protein